MYLIHRIPVAAASLLLAVTLSSTSAVRADSGPSHQAFAPEHSALNQVEERFVEQVLAARVGPKRAKSREWKRLPLDEKYREAHDVAIKLLAKKFPTPQALKRARSLMNEARVVKMTPLEITEPMMTSGRLKSPTEKGIVAGAYPHPKSAHVSAMSHIFGASQKTVQRAFKNTQFPRYGYVHFGGIAKDRSLFTATSNGHSTYGELMWIYKNDHATRSLATMTEADSGNVKSLGLPLSPNYTDFQLAEMTTGTSIKPMRTKKQVDRFFVDLAQPKGLGVGVPEGQVFQGDLRNIEAVAIVDNDLHGYSDSVPYGFVEYLRKHKVPFYVIRTDPKTSRIVDPERAARRSTWHEVKTSLQLYKRFMDKELVDGEDKRFRRAAKRAAERARTKSKPRRHTRARRGGK